MLGSYNNLMVSNTDCSYIHQLVSVVIITYNSGKYILDGLESIKAQTYHNIELIVSDDCSTDNTIDICKQWIEKNGSRFVNCKLITAEHNTGVAGNLNRGIAAATGEWIKHLAGDDQLPPYSIERYMHYASTNTDADIWFAKLRFIGSDEELTKKTEQVYEKSFYPHITMPLKHQIRQNLISLYLPGPGLIYKRALWEEIGGFDERYQFAEEHPFTTKVLESGRKVHFIDEKLCNYQVHEGSLSKNNGQLSTRTFNDVYNYFFDVRRKKMIQHGLILNCLDEYINLRFQRSLLYNAPDRRLYSFMRFLSPLKYIQKIRCCFLTNN